MVFVGPAIRLAMQLFLARMLTPDVFSEFVLVWTAALFSIGIVTSQVLTYNFHYPNDELTVNNQLFISLIIILVVSVGSAIFLLQTYPNVDFPPFLIMSFVLTHTYSEILRKVWIKKRFYKKVFKAEAIYSLSVIFALTTIYILQFKNIESILIALTVISIFFSAMLWIKIDPSIKANLKKWIKFGVPITISSMIQFISGNYFIFVASDLYEFNVIGELSLTRTLFSPLALCLTLIDINHSEPISNRLKNGSDSILNVCKIVIPYLFLIVPFAVIAIFSRYFFNYEFLYTELSKIIAILCMVNIFIVINRVLSIYVRASSKNINLMLAGITSLIITVVLTKPAGEYMGPAGLYLVLLGQQLIFTTIYCNTLVKQKIFFLK